MKKISYISSILLALIFVTACFSISPDDAHSARIDPGFKFKTIETENFVIHYHQGLDDIALKAATMSENIHLKLAPVLKWTPAEKTNLVLLDNIDFANGMATVLPYNAIYIFVVSPAHDTIIGEYDDWLEMVLLHEYAHILTMDPSRGYSEWTRKLFGKTIPGYDILSSLLFLFTTPPNVFMPNWWLEGIATWAETEFTEAGRGRSSYVDMIFRMSVLEDAIPAVDEINGDVPSWPSGSVPYIYGMMLEKYIADKHGSEMLADLSIAHAGRLPFMISAPAEELAGSHYTGLYRSMVRDLEAEQFGKIERLNSKPLTDFSKLSFEGEQLTNPRLSPDGKYLAFNRRDPHEHEEIAIVERASLREIASVRRFPSDRSMAWSADSTKLYFTQADFNDTYNIYQDIYSYEVQSESVSQVTKLLRAKDIDLSPEGEQVVFVKIETGRQNIAVLSFKDMNVKKVTEYKDSALSYPKWSPDGHSIVFTRHEDEGTSLVMLDVASKQERVLFKDEFYNINPTWTPDGKSILFTSNRTGVYNLFAYLIDAQKLFQVSHAMGGMFQPDISKGDNKIVFSGYNSKGFFIGNMAYDESDWTEDFSPVIGSEWNESQEQVSINVSAETLDKGKYSPWKTLAPKFWLPTLTFDHEGPVLGAITAGQDVLGYHTFIAQGGIGTEGDGYYNIAYVYDRWQPTLFVNAFSQPFFYSELFNNGDDYHERRESLTVGTTFPALKLNTLERRVNITLGYNFLKLEDLEDLRRRAVDGINIYEGRRDNFFAGFSHSSALKYPYSVSREEGRTLSFMYRKYTENLDQAEYEADYEEFIGIRDKKNDVLYVNIKGAAQYGEQIAQQAFSIGGVTGPGNKYSLRGFSSGFETGKYVMTGTLEYRLPVWDLFRGWNTKPFFLERLHGAVFVDAGDVWGNGEGFRLSDFSMGIGWEARFDITIGYKLKITPAIGIAHGVTDDGEIQPYITVYTAL